MKNEIFPKNKFEWYSGLMRIDEFRGEFDKEPEDGIFEYLEIENGNINKESINKVIYNHIMEYARKVYVD